MQDTATLELKHWQPRTIPAEQVDNYRSTGEYTWFVREVGPWRLEVFPPEPPEYGDDDVPASLTLGRWYAQCELDGGEMLAIEAATLPEAARLIEQMLATTLTSCLMGLVGGQLPDDAWETAVSLGES